MCKKYAHVPIRKDKNGIYDSPNLDILGTRYLRVDNKTINKDFRIYWQYPNDKKEILCIGTLEQCNFIAKLWGAWFYEEMLVR